MQAHEQKSQYLDRLHTATFLVNAAGLIWCTTWFANVGMTKTKKSDFKRRKNKPKYFKFMYCSVGWRSLYVYKRDTSTQSVVINGSFSFKTTSLGFFFNLWRSSGCLCRRNIRNHEVSGHKIVDFTIVRVCSGGGVLPYIGYIGIYDAKGYGFLAVLAWMVSSLIILVWNRVWFVHSSLELVGTYPISTTAHYATCFIVWNFKLETLYSFVS